MGTKRIVFITGANRGIGFEVARQLAEKGDHVILGCRSLAKAKKSQTLLQKMGLKVEIAAIELMKESSIDRAIGNILKKHKRIDVLINNGGVLIPETNDFKAKTKTLLTSFQTNTLAAFRLCQLVVPVMKKHGYGRVVNLSSGMGQLSDMNSGHAGYRISKTALNAVTRIFSDLTSGSDVLVNSVCPGWVKTEMGGKEAERDIPKGAETPVWLANLPSGGPTGLFFRDKAVFPW